MDHGGRYENGRYKLDYYKGPQSPWGMMPQQQVKDPMDALSMNKKVMPIINERNAAIQERDKALVEKREALVARDEALQQRDQALAERDNAYMERDKALAALQYQENAMNFPLNGIQRGGKRATHPVVMPEPLNTVHTTETYTVASEGVKSRQVKVKKENNAVSLKPLKSPRKGKRASDDLNTQVASAVKKCRTEWDSMDVGLNLINFDETTMPVPVCSCTGVPRQCYKWGNGGWQSSCCTTTLSSYPLPQMPNKRHARVGGRKMSGSVFTRLLSHMAAEGRDLVVPIDLKSYWARHGTNRYITIK